MRAIMFFTAVLCAGAAALPRVLVFSKVQTGQYVHASIPDGSRAIAAMGKTKGFAADTTADATVFTAANLARYGAVVFNNTGGEVLDASQRAAFQAFLRAGGGYAGFHSACGTEYSWPWYGEMLGGGRFLKHPAIQKAAVKVEDAKHASTSMLPQRWERVDEWHDYQANPRMKCRVLLTLDETSYQGGTMGADHPIAWCRDYEGGRAWFTGLGHGPESFKDTLFLAHLWGGIQYALGPAPVVTLAGPWQARAYGARHAVGASAWVWTGTAGAGIFDLRGARIRGSGGQALPIGVFP